MTAKKFVGGKIHGIRVTEAFLHYQGSVTISDYLLKEAGMSPFEMVHVVNLNNGERWQTYLLPTTKPGYFSLNGGGARLGVPGDECVLFTEVFEADGVFKGAKVLHMSEDNIVTQTTEYWTPGGKNAQAN